MTPEQLADLRAHYADVGLDRDDLAADPIAQFRSWLAEVVDLGLPEPNAMVLATADEAATPSTRHVLLKGVDVDGFVFFTNYGSHKAREIAINPAASLCFPWFCIGRQVVVTGLVTKVTRAQTEAYFATRPRGSQIGAWASEHQSAPVASRAVLDAAYAAAAQRFAGVRAIPAPPFWGGMRLTPSTIEFWQGRGDRMHDRLRYRRGGETGWLIERLSP